MLNFSPALLRRLEVQAQRQGLSSAELLNRWLTDTEALPDRAPLTENERRLQIISEMTSDYAYTFIVAPDHSMQLEWITAHAFERITGYTPAEVIAHGGWPTLLHPADRAVTEAIVARLLTAPSEQVYEYRMVRRDGDIRCVQAINRSVADSTGRVYRLYGTVRDITEPSRYAEALRDSEQRYRMLADNVQDTIVSINPDNSINYISPSVEQLLGYPPEAFVGHSVTEWVHPDHIDKLYACWQEVITQGKTEQQSEYLLRHKCGHYVWIETRSQFSSLPAVSVWRDITERKKAEAALHGIESRFAAVFHHSPLSISLRPLDQDHYVEVNDSFLDLFGYTREEILAGAVTSETIWIDGDAHETFNRIRAEQHRVVQFEHKLRRKSGEIRTALVSSVVVDINSRPYSITFAQDITARKQADRLKQDAESLFTNVFHNSPIAISLRNRRTSEVFEVNTAFLQLLGYTLDDFHNGRVTTADIWASEEDRQDYWARRAVSPLIRDAEYKFRTRTGEIVDVLVSSTMFEINGDPVSLTFTQNITALRQSEQVQRERDQLRAALEKEHEVNQIANRVIRTISHEFRTPLATIRSAGFTLGRMSGDLSEPANLEKRDKRLHVIDNQVTVLDNLIDDISLLVRNISGQLLFHPTLIELDLLCRASIEELQATLGLQHVMVFESSGEIQQIVADKRLLERILINLLSNAIKYSAPGTSIYLRLRKDDDQAIITISDQGWGIAPADLELLFTPYFRVENDHGITGIGLGLSIVRECVERHSGHISVESQVNRGTTFTVTLPLQQTPTQPTACSIST